MPTSWKRPHPRTTLVLGAFALSVTGLLMTDQARLACAAPSAQNGQLTLTRDPTLATNATLARDPTLATNATTAIPFEGPGATGRFAISHSTLLASGSRRMYAEVRLRASREATAAQRAPVTMALLIDTSGSMTGSKIAGARRAALALVDEMHDDDTLSVVRFSSTVEELVAPARVRDIRALARSRIAGLTAGGATDIANALRSAERALEGAGTRGVARVVLVTDGRDTSGAPRRAGLDVASAEAAQGITVSALGVGTDFDEEYVSEIASAGRGNYEFLQDSSSLARFLSKELHETSQTVLEQAVAELRLPSNVHIREVWGATREGDRLSLGALFAGDERRVIVAFEVETAAPGSELVLSAQLSWQPVGRPRVELPLAALAVRAVRSVEQVEDGRDLSVVASAASVEASSRESEAARAFERGDRARALELNAQNRAALADAARAAPRAVASKLEAQAKAYETHQGVFAQAPAAAPARSISAGELKNLSRVTY